MAGTASPWSLPRRTALLMPVQTPPPGWGEDELLLFEAPYFVGLGDSDPY